MSQTIQETITSHDYTTAMKRIATLGFLTSTPTSNLYFWNTGTATRKGVFSNIALKSPWGSNTISNIYMGYSLSDVQIKVTYNIDKKLCAITGYSETDTAAPDASYVRIPLLITNGDYFSVGKQWGANGPDTFATITPSFNWYQMLGQSSGATRLSPDGKVALQSNPLLGFEGSSTALAQLRLQGSGIYVAKEDIAGPWDDVGRIIADEAGNAYICCGNRIWMDYDSE